VPRCAETLMPKRYQLAELEQRIRSLRTAQPLTSRAAHISRIHGVPDAPQGPAIPREPGSLGIPHHPCCSRGHDDDMRDLIPGGGESNRTPTVYRNEFLALHREMNRLFDEAFRDFGVPSLFGRMPASPSVEIADTDKEVRGSADLPGLEEKDVEVLTEDGVLTLRGEKRSQVEDSARQFTERSYGRVEPRIPLGFKVDEDKVAALFKNGVLTVTLPKSEKAQAKRIAINGSGAAQ
jgi:HSP20 family protein